MVGCSVLGCKSNTKRKEADITFHAFPTENEICKTWIAGTGKKNWVPHKYSRICSKHFEHHCFRKTQKLTFIEKFSIPTLFIHNVPVTGIDPKNVASIDVDYQHHQINVSVEKYPKCPVSREVQTEPLPTEPMECQNLHDMHAQQCSMTAKSIECAKSSNKSMPFTQDLITSPRKFKLTLQLNRQTLLAESRRKKIEALRSKTRRLLQKNAELSAIIEDLKTNGLFNEVARRQLINTTCINNSSLKEILDQQTPNRTCRLCLRPGGSRIFGGDQESDVALNIQYILGIDIIEDDGKPQHICSECEHTVRQAARLKETAETNQWRLQQELDMVGGPPAESSDDTEPLGGYFKTNDTDVTREWVCGTCRAAFHTQEEFSEHERLPSCRTLDRSYVCETCGLELKTMSRLKRHRLTHTATLPHQCGLCPYRARTQYALRVHARAHSGARPARCPHCPATFANSSNLASHRRKHMPPRYHCQFCQKGFKFKIALRNHMATQHSNAKPYNCCICAKAFSTRKMILRHELKAHNRPKMRSGVLPSYMRQLEHSP